MTTNPITDKQNERIAKAMGWQSTGLSENWGRDWNGNEWPRLASKCPRYDVPGVLHEEMVERAEIETWRHSNRGCDQGWSGAPFMSSFSFEPSFSPNRTAAECLAFLAWLDYQEGK